MVKISEILDKTVKIPYTSSAKLFLCTSCASLTVKLYKHSAKTFNKRKSPDIKIEKERKRSTLTPVKITPLKQGKRKCLTSIPKFKHRGETSRPSYLQKHGFKDKVI